MARTDISGSLAGALAAAVPPDGGALGAVSARLVMWHLDLRRELERGDGITVAYRREDGKFVVGAAVYTSRRRGRSYRAYRFQAPGDPFPSYWDEQGAEVPFRLKNGPLRSYEQITALLKDRPTHRGMDFKAPTGTPVHAPRAGRVTRANWRTAANGRCLEIEYDDGVRARFLHLSEVRAAPGQRVQAGQVVALTGNTGRSTAPHLHYELSRGGQVVDPVEYHGVVRRTLPPAARGPFRAEMAAMDRLLAPPAPAPGAAAAGAP